MHLAIKRNRELLSFFLKSLESMGLKAATTLQTATGLEIQINFNDCPSGWKRTLFSYVASDEPITKKDDKSKIDFSF